MGLVALFSTLSRLLYGAWVDGTPALLVLGYLAGFLAVLGVGLYLVGPAHAARACHGGGREVRRTRPHFGVASERRRDG